MRVFLITGAAIGVVGTLVGFLVGLVVCLNIEIDPAVPVLAHQHRAVLARALFPVAAAGRARCRRDHRGGGDGAGAVVAGDALPVLARRAARSGRSAALRMRQPMAEQRKTTGRLSARGRAALPPGRRDAGNPQRRRARALAGPVGGAGGAVGRRQVDAAAHRRPAGASRRRRGLSRRRRRPRHCRTPSARGSAATRSASSTSPTICCRNSPRSRTSCCRR